MKKIILSVCLALALSLPAQAQIAPRPVEFGSPGDAAGPLDGSGKIPAAQMPLSALEYKGAWNATTNTPTLANGAGTTGDMYRISVTGSQNLGGGVVNYPAGDFLIYDGAEWDLIGAGAAVVPGNPTASVGLNAVNGAANTFMRSDAAPAINQTITPAWTGAHAFNFVSSQSTPTLRVGGTNPQLEIQNPSAAVDAKRWQFEMGSSSPSLILRTVNDSGSAAATVLTLNRAANVPSEAIWSIPESIVTGVDGRKLWLAKYNAGAGHNNAPTAIGAAATYMYVGGREYGNNGYGGIGFSYVGSPADNPAVWIGWQERNTAGNTNGDFIVATRSETTNTAPTERLRITNLGAWAISGLANTGTAGQVITSTGAGTPPTWQTLTSSGTYTPTFTAVANNTAPAANAPWFYSQNGKMVQVSGTLSLAPSSSPANVQVGISLPIPLTTASSYQIVGSGVSIVGGTSVDTTGAVAATTEPGLNRANLLITVGSTELRYVNIAFSYMLP